MELVDIVKAENLLKFAEEFSEKFKELSSGKYIDSSGKYTIIITDKIVLQSTGKTSATPTRINTETGIAQFSKYNLSDPKITANWIYYLVIWTFVRLFCDTEAEADYITMEYYLTTGRLKKDILIGYSVMFNLSDSVLNRNRFVIIKNIIRGKLKYPQGLKYS